jgi:ketol-acid reductoisomerase
VRSGAFARDWVEEYRNGMPTMARLRAEGASSQLEKVGADVRRMFGATRDPAGKGARTIEVSPPSFAAAK